MAEDKIEKEEITNTEVETSEVETSEVETAESSEVETSEVDASETAEVETGVVADENLSEKLEVLENSLTKHIIKGEHKKGKLGKKGTIAICALVFCLVLVFAIAGVNTYHSYVTHYEENFDEGCYELLSDGYTAYVVISARITYWDENDEITEAFVDILTDLENSYAENEAIIESLAHPPSGYEEKYELLVAYHDAIVDCMYYAFNYDTDADTYYANSIAALEVFVEYYDLLVADYISE